MNHGCGDVLTQPDGRPRRQDRDEDRPDDLRDGRHGGHQGQGRGVDPVGRVIHARGDRVGEGRSSGRGRRVVADVVAGVHQRGRHRRADGRVHRDRGGGVVAEGGGREVAGTSVRSVLHLLDLIILQWRRMEIV